jgi:hypothetical protein
MKPLKYRSRFPRKRKKSSRRDRPSVSREDLEREKGLMDIIIADDKAAYAQWWKAMATGFVVCFVVIAITFSYSVSGPFDLARTPDRLFLAFFYGIQLALFFKGIAALRTLMVRMRARQPQSEYAYSIRWRIIRFAFVQCGLAMALIPLVRQKGWFYEGTVWIESHLRPYLAANWRKAPTTLLSFVMSGTLGNAAYEILRRLVHFGKRDTALDTSRPLARNHRGR